MEQLIPVINKLQDVTAVVESNPLDLPQIVVVGEQSSGKSSVLESLVGRDFLPRGSGIVTRRPLILQLNYKRHIGSGPKEWGEFLHLPGRKFADFAEIRREIQADTDRISGQNKGVSPQPISLRIYSPNVLNLTLVDLPGLTKVPVGDQPKDISNQIRAMVLEYISRPSAIILAISPANADIANSDGLRIAREVDPHGERTIGVLTKLDLMDKGTDCFDVLQGRVYHLKYGFIAALNRSQHDINTNLSVDKARENEMKFFEAHPLYKQIVSRCGTKHLSESLNKILMNHIRNTLPELRNRVNGLLQTSRDELNALGDPRIGVSKGAMLLHIINAFVHSYWDTIDGRLSSASATAELYGVLTSSSVGSKPNLNELPTQSLHLKTVLQSKRGARINYIFHDLFGAYVDGIDALGGLSDEEVQVIMANATGPKASLFIPEESFEQLAKRQIRILEDPAARCVDLVYDELQRIVNCIDLNELKRFDNLKEKIVEVVVNMLRDFKDPTKRMITNLIAIEQSYINTNHPDFIGGGDAIAKILRRRAERQVKRQQQASDASLPAELQGQFRSQVEQMRAQAEKEKSDFESKQREAERKKQEQAKAEEDAKRKQQAGFSLFGIFGGQNQQQQQRQMASSSSSQPAPSSSSSSSSTSASRSSAAASTPAFPPSSMAPVPAVVQIKQRKDRSENEDFQTELIETLLKSYFKIVRKNVKDRVPKSIMCFLVNKSKEEIQNRLVEELYREDQFTTLLAEGSDVAQRREQFQQTIKICTDAQKILNEIVDYKI